MTLQDAQHDDFQHAFPGHPASLVDVADLPTNPLLPGVLPADLAARPSTGAGRTPGSLTGSAGAVIDPLTPANPSTNQFHPGPFPNTQMPSASPISTGNGIAPQTPFPSGVPSIQPAPLLSSTPPPRSAPGKRLDAKALLSICAAFVLLVLSAGGLIVNFAYYQPYRLHMAATATGIAIPTITARARQTSVASAQQTQVAQQQATTTAEQTIYTQAVSGKPFLTDALNEQSPNGWDEGAAPQNSSCAFTNGSYVVYQPNTDYFLPCFAENPTFASFALQVDMKVLQGDEGGVMFRADSTSVDGYIFCLDNFGNYELDKVTDKTANMFYGQSYDYRTDQKNRLTIIVRDNTFYFYINQHFIKSATDKTFGEGIIGLLAADNQNATTVAYNNLKIWLLS